MVSIKIYNTKNELIILPYAKKNFKFSLEFCDTDTNQVLFTTKLGPPLVDTCKHLNK